MTILKKLITYIFVLLLSFSCSKKKKKLQIVCTTTMIADMARQIAGDKCEIIGLMNAGVDPHAYKATSKDISYLHSADIIFHNGLHLEGKMSDALKNYGKSGKHCYAVSAKIPKEKLLFDENIGEDSVDPHIWVDPDLWIECVKYVTEILVKVDSKNASFYKEREKKYLEELADLKKYLNEEFSKIPDDKRILISAHDAFSYFGKCFNMKIIGLQGISTVSECGMKDIESMIEFINKNKVKAIFLETSVPESSIMSVVEGCKRRGFEIKIGGHLYSDALGEANKEEGTYIGMMKHNASVIVSSLI